MSTTKATEPKTFEAASKRLDELIAAMESGQLPLDKMIAAFEEGRKLVAFCNAKLSEVQQRVEKIKAAEADGSLIREPM
ncbi:MAG: exodeoxyribonuclease VII small subunit, partial [Kiritimatiellae bacterium]|nr:exodeoxyribonuclease VII small subunit [Kiritimatiellia bacterium]